MTVRKEKKHPDDKKAGKTTTPEQKRHLEEQKKLLSQVLNPAQIKELMAAERGAVRERVKARGVFCAGCQTIQTPEMDKFLRCAKCWEKLHEEVRYCSK